MFHKDSQGSYQVKLINKDKSLDTTIQVRSDEVIMDAAEQQGIELPISCRAGACITCTGKLVEGTVEHLYCFLKRQEEEASFISPYGLSAF